MDQDKEQNKEAGKSVPFESCVGKNSKYVKLVSRDGHEFIIKREFAMLSGTINAMMSGPGQFTENETNVIHLKAISSEILQKVCMYLTYKSHYKNYHSNIPDFPVPPQIALELLMAANFLDC